MAGIEDRIESRSRSFVPEEGWAKVSVPSGGPRLEKFNQRRVKFVRQRLSNESDDLLHTRDVRKGGAGRHRRIPAQRPHSGTDRTRRISPAQVASGSSSRSPSLVRRTMRHGPSSPTPNRPAVGRGPESSRCSEPRIGARTASKRGKADDVEARRDGLPIRPSYGPQASPDASSRPRWRIECRR